MPVHHNGQATQLPICANSFVSCGEGRQIWKPEERTPTMPHFVIEYSRDVEAEYDIGKIMQIAFEAGVASGEMQGADIKVRAHAYDHYRLLNAGDSFLHLSVFLLAGRTDAQKEHIALLQRAALTDYLTAVTAVSIDIRDMNTVAYKKRLLD